MKFLLLSVLVILVLPSPSLQEGYEEFSKQIKCLVCQATTHEMDLAIAKINENKTIDIQGYGLDKKAKKLVYAKSEMFLTELMEDVCKKVDDYLKATYRDTQKLTIIKMSHDENKEGKGTLSDEVGLVEFVQDGDLNRSLPVVCFEILEDNENIFLEHYMSNVVPYDSQLQICYQRAKYCNANLNGVYGSDEATLKFKKSP